MAVPGLALGGTAEAECAGRPLKVCVFSDLHYEPGCFVNDTPAFLSAILTLSPDGGIRIEGSKSDFLFEATPEKAGLDPYDVNGRRVTAEIQSANLKFSYC